jgi:hypothetical protein
MLAAGSALAPSLLPVVAKLQAGRYVLACFLPDDRGVLHAADGMVAGFVVG